MAQENKDKYLDKLDEVQEKAYVIAEGLAVVIVAFGDKPALKIYDLENVRKYIIFKLEKDKFVPLLHCKCTELMLYKAWAVVANCENILLQGISKVTADEVEIHRTNVNEAYFDIDMRLFISGGICLKHVEIEQAEFTNNLGNVYQVAKNKHGFLKVILENAAKCPAICAVTVDYKSVWPKVLDGSLVDITIYSKATKDGLMGSNSYRNLLCAIDNYKDDAGYEQNFLLCNERVRDIEKFNEKLNSSDIMVVYFNKESL